MVTLAFCLAALAFPQDGLSHSKAELVASVRSFKPGEPFEVGLQFTMTPGWHVYWRNPGESGQEVRVKWNLPVGWKVGTLKWPVPEVIEDAGIVNYGYSGQVVLRAVLTPPKDAKQAKIAANLSWLVCDDEMCLPAKRSVNLTLSRSDHAVPAPAFLALAGGSKARPIPGPGSLAGASAVLAGRTLIFRFTMPAGRVSAQFFPYDPTVVGSGAFSLVGVNPNQPAEFRLPKSEFFDDKATRFRGVLILRGEPADRDEAIEVDLPLIKRSGGNQ